MAACPGVSPPASRPSRTTAPFQASSSDRFPSTMSRCIEEVPWASRPSMKAIRSSTASGGIVTPRAPATRTTSRMASWSRPRVSGTARNTPMGARVTAPTPPVAVMNMSFSHSAAWMSSATSTRRPRHLRSAPSRRRTRSVIPPSSSPKVTHGSAPACRTRPGPTTYEIIPHRPPTTCPRPKAPTRTSAASTPFRTGTTIVAGPTSGGIASAASGNCHVLVATMTASTVPTSEGSSVASIGSIAKSPPTPPVPNTATRIVDRLFPAEEPEQEGLLRVQAVLGLVPHHRVRPVDHLVRDLLATMCGETVHDDGVVHGQRQLIGVDPEGGEHQDALGVLSLLAHRGPHVRVQDVRAVHGGQRVVPDLDRPPGLRGDLTGPLDDLRDRLQPRRGGPPA